MGNAATERMLAVVANARSEARSAESDYETMEMRIQLKSSSSINLYGGTATSQVVEIASMARKACDDLYASYQMLVRMVDEECRPLLDQQPELNAVKEVKDLIVWLNDESEIEANFSATFNYNSLGNVASSKYVPTMENKMIQKYWENKYAMWPGRAEEEQRQREEAEAKRKREAELAKLKAEEEQKKFDAEMAEYNVKQAEIETLHRNLMEEFLTKTEKELKEAALKEKEAVINKNTRIKANSLSDKAEAESRLALLGIFKFSEKKAEKEKIAACEVKIAEAEAQLKEAPIKYQKTIDNIPSVLSGKKAEYQKELNNKYPLPKKPRMNSYARRAAMDGREMTAVQMANMDIKDQIVEFLEENEGMMFTITELMEGCDALADLSNMRVSALVRQLVTDGLVERLEEKRKAYFRLAK